MGVDHVLYRVGYDVARGKRVQHTVVAHGDAVVYGYGVKLGRVTAHGLYLVLNYLPYLMEMGVPGYKLCKRIDNGNNGLAKLLGLHSGCHPQGSGAGKAAPHGTYRTSQLFSHTLSFYLGTHRGCHQNHNCYLLLMQRYKLSHNKKK